MAMNIRTDLEQRLKDVLSMTSKPPQLSVKGSVQPVINYENLIPKFKEITQTVAGNVTIDIISDMGETIKIRKGHLYCLNDGTVANRYLVWDIENTQGTRLIRLLSSAVTASQKGEIIYTELISNESNLLYSSSSNMNATIWGSDRSPIQNGQSFHWEISNGVAGDTVELRLELEYKNIPKEDIQ